MESIIKNGKEQIKKNRFSLELVSEIEKIKYRDKLLKKIFIQENIPFEKQTIEIKKRRKLIMDLKSSFYDYLNLFDKYKVTSFLLLGLSLIMLTFSLLKFNSNLLFGLLTLIQGGILFGISKNRKFSIKSILLVILIFALLLGLEFVVLGIPKPLFEMMSNDILEKKQGSLTRIINLLTPIIYILVKIGVLGILVYLFIKKKDFLVKIEELEKSKYVG